MSWWNSLASGASDYFSSGDGWGTLFNSIIGGISGVSKGKSDEKAAKLAGEFALRGVREGGMENRRSAEFETSLSKWLKDKEKEDRRKGLSNYARMSSVDYGPQSYVPPEVGDMPTQMQFDADAYDDKGNRRSLASLARGGG